MSRARNALRTQGQSLTLPTAISVLLHVGAVVGAMLARGIGAVMIMLFPWCASNPEPLLDNSIEVAVVSLPKSKTALPDRASRAPTPRKAPKKEVAPVPEPPPVKQSDLAVRTKKPAPEPSDPDSSNERADALAEILRQDALSDLDAPEGPTNQLPTSPDGVGDEVIGSGVGAMGDPEMARWYGKVKALYQAEFNPIGNRTDLVATGRIKFDPNTGQVISSELVKSSGVLGFDASARSALARIRSIPPPPNGKGNSVDLQFELNP